MADAEDEAVNEQRMAFEENMSKKENQMKELDRVSKSLSEELKNLHLEVKVKRDSEDQMKQVLKEYEKTISELVAEKEREKLTSEEERLRLIAERDQAVEDLRVSLFLPNIGHRYNFLQISKVLKVFTAFVQMFMERRAFN